MTFWENDNFKTLKENTFLFHVVTFLLCFFAPPLACYLIMVRPQYRYRFDNEARCWVILLLNVFLCFLAWAPGVIFALVMYVFVAIGGCLYNAGNA
ncbi:hypothetical protein AKO1_013313 [Acrasis kona]|uniref:Uncharacterized protein n=1 Tax=Acrasis kona TaxID=1008807 RepID=A0AAW2YYF3_9EUKA